MRENNQMKYEKKKKIGSKMQTEIIHERSLLNYPLQINPDDIGLVKSAQDKQIMDDGYRCSGLFGTSVKHFSLTRTHHHSLTGTMLTTALSAAGLAMSGRSCHATSFHVGHVMSCRSCHALSCQVR